MLIINAKILSMDNNDYQKGYILIEDKKIKDIGDMKDLPKTTEEILDVDGKTVIPGLIDAHCHLGMWEDGLGFEGDDGNEETDPITPHLRAIDAINPLDRCFEEALEGGVTTVLTGAGSANPIAGMWCAIKTKGRRIDDMIINDKVGMKFALGENPKNTYNGKSETPITRMAITALIREQLQKAKRYSDDIAEATEISDLPEFDMKCDSLLPVIRKQCKAFFHCHRTDDIFTAIRISKEFDLDYVIVHGTEGYMIADILAEEKAKVITGPLLCDRSKPEIRNLSISNPYELDKNNVQCCICTDHPVIPIQYLPLTAGLGVRSGLSKERALEMITIESAKIAGIEDRVGSITVGKDADLVIFEDDILNVYFKPSYVIVDGKVVVKN